MLAALGHTPQTARLALTQAADAASATRRLHLAFVAPSRAHVDAFWRAGVAAGHPDDGAPGPRPRYLPDYHGAFLLDPDGNSAEAVHGGAVPAGSPASIDHLWIRVADLAAARERWLALAPRVGLRAAVDTAERVSFRTGHGGISLVAGEPTIAAHLTLRARERDDPGGVAPDPHGGSVEILPVG